jgi:DNA-directed RNA polymerase specialized sigma24 family protein
MNGLSEGELLGLMSADRQDPSGARAAWGEMYRRHSRYVSAVVARMLGDRARDSEVVPDIVGDAFQTLFDWAGKHGSTEDIAQRFGAPDDESVRWNVLGFLAAVARRLAQHRFSARARRRQEFLGGDADVEQAVAVHGEDAGPPRTEGPKLEEILDLLGLDEAEALRLSLPWYEVETGEFAFPRGEAARVAASLGITPEALRQRRHRSLRHLELRLGGAHPGPASR